MLQDLLCLHLPKLHRTMCGSCYFKWWIDSVPGRREKINQENAEWRKKNPEKSKLARLNYKKNNPEKHAESMRRGRMEYNSKPENIKKRNTHLAVRRENDIQFRMKIRLRNRFSRILKRRGIKKLRGGAMRLLGCSLPEFISHIEKQFTVGMSWENYGEWHIDHIKPCTDFDLSQLEEQAACFHFSNLRPLWAKDNIVSGILHRWKKSCR